MKIKEYQIKQNEFRRPVLIVKNVHDIQKVHEISEYNSPEVIVDSINQIFDVAHLAEEYVWMITTTSSFQVTGIFEISHGSINLSIFSPREIIQRALMAGAVNVILAHCHPSGDPSPSDQDIVATEQLYKACKLMRIPLLDHIIIGCNNPLQYYSFNEKDIMKSW